MSLRGGELRPRKKLPPVLMHAPRRHELPEELANGQTATAQAIQRSAGVACAACSSPWRNVRRGSPRSQLGLRAQVSAKGGSFDTYLSKARVPGWVINDGDRIRITEEGLKALGSYDPLPEGRELLDYYVRHFGSSGAARMLTALAEAYPRALSRQELSEQSNVSAAGGSFDTYLSKLRTLELVEGKAELRASEELFS